MLPLARGAAFPCQAQPRGEAPADGAAVGGEAHPQHRAGSVAQPGSFSRQALCVLCVGCRVGLWRNALLRPACVAPGSRLGQLAIGQDASLELQHPHQCSKHGWIAKFTYVADGKPSSATFLRYHCCLRGSSWQGPDRGLDAWMVRLDQCIHPPRTGFMAQPTESECVVLACCLGA